MHIHVQQFLKTILQGVWLQMGLEDTWSMAHSKYVIHYGVQSGLPYNLTTPRRLSTLPDTRVVLWFEPWIRNKYPAVAS
jgi:hypothetical protein